MKGTLKERFRRKMLRFGKKNKFCRLLAFPVVVTGTFAFHVAEYCRGNGKRFAMLGMTFLLFAVYSSFSFPIFVSGDGETQWNVISEDAQDIVLAEETEVDLEDIVRLDEEEGEVLDAEDYMWNPENVEAMEQYSASDILEANADRLPASSEKESGEGEDYRNHVFTKDDWRLILVNPQHSIPEGYEANIPLGKINTMKGVMRCDERIIDDLLRMIQAAKEDGVTLSICSPYRDMAHQRSLFNRKINKFMDRGLSYMEAYQLASERVNVPNASEHQIGLALDIVTVNYTELNEGFADTDAGKWLAANSCRYGFILRYPKGKEDVTGVSYEPWHFRYVGVEAATVITEEGITLEEFWEEFF